MQGSPAAPVFYAHRLGAAETDRPLNSRAGFDAYLDLRELMPGRKVEGIETDCSITADGDLALIHWALLDIETDQTGLIHEEPTSVVRAARLRAPDGQLTDEPVLLADEFFEMLRTDPRAADLRVLFEIKSYASSEIAALTASRACDLIIEFGLEGRVEVLSYWFEACQEAAARGLKARFVTHGNPDAASVIDLLLNTGVKAIDYEHFMIAEQRLREFQAAGLDVTTFLPNPSLQLLEHHLRLGLDGINTERPIRASGMLDELRSSGAIAL